MGGKICHVFDGTLIHLCKLKMTTANGVLFTKTRLAMVSWVLSQNDELKSDFQRCIYGECVEFVFNRLETFVIQSTGIMNSGFWTLPQE